MASKLPIVIGSAGMMEQMQVGDVLDLTTIPTDITVDFVPLTSADWAGDPPTVGLAIDRLAAALSHLLGVPIP